MATPASASNDIKVTLDALDWEWKPTISITHQVDGPQRTTHTFGGDSLGDTANAGVIDLGSFTLPSLTSAQFSVSEAARTSPDGDTTFVTDGLNGDINQPDNPLRIGELTLDAPSNGGAVGASLAKPDGYELKFALSQKVPQKALNQLTSLRSMTPSPQDCTITGTDGPDVIEGTDGDDVICAGAGDDKIAGKGGNDVIYAGPGNDKVDAGAGDDKVKGGAGDDQLRGSSGSDVMGGGPGDDQMDGGSGDDAMHGATGEDILVGGDGNDLTDGGSAEDALLPDATADQVAQAIGGAWDIDADSEWYSTRAVLAPRTSMSSQARWYQQHLHTLASTDAIGNIVEDGNGDAYTAQTIGCASWTFYIGYPCAPPAD
jgi:hypothetical protein